MCVRFNLLPFKKTNPTFASYTCEANLAPHKAFRRPVSHFTNSRVFPMAFVASSSIVRPSLQRASLCNGTSSFGKRLSVRVAPSRSAVSMSVLPIFTNAMEVYKKEYPSFAARGWGATVKAERWNGRHAMFGFVMLVATAYCKGHGLLPEGVLDPKDWGVLGSLGDTGMISNERAVILVAHIHVLMVSVAAALAPFSFQDTLLLAPGEADEEPAGLFPEFKLGLTKSAELYNCRLAMLGLMVVVGCSVATGTPILDVLNIGLGKILY
eukprot:TRINITY_DN1159_c0_g1_i1.p1 TRINITY_DN1159_c0_g1~~TRINITY_DN1159_c0_g1_i1.p1  ORF type:complete len:267 (+),score=32.09 TRINITY_DN1159_c0_g1_i1:2485-3285(+)